MFRLAALAASKFLAKHLPFNVWVFMAAGFIAGSLVSNCGSWSWLLRVIDLLWL